jgi:hypothetical protein
MECDPGSLTLFQRNRKAGDPPAFFIDIYIINRYLKASLGERILIMSLKRRFAELMLVTAVVGCATPGPTPEQIVAAQQAAAEQAKAEAARAVAALDRAKLDALATAARIVDQQAGINPPELTRANRYDVASLTAQTLADLSADARSKLLAKLNDQIAKGTPQEAFYALIAKLQYENPTQIVCVSQRGVLTLKWEKFDPKGDIVVKPLTKDGFCNALWAAVPKPAGR